MKAPCKKQIGIGVDKIEFHTLDVESAWTK